MHKIIANLLLIFLISSCAVQDELPLPQEIGKYKLESSKKNSEAVKDINDLHGTEVATDKNVIGRYESGDKNFDLLYVSMYSDSKACKIAFEKMVSKMKKAENTPFFHLIAMPEYENKLFFTIGMGAFHYIYTSGKYLVWLQTYQDIGRLLPENLTAIYPVK